jgi:signal transduction histidine kinase
MSRPAQHTAAIVVIDAVLFTLCIFGVYNVSQKPWLDAHLAGSPDHIIIEKLHADPDETSLRVGDVLISVNEREVSTPQEVEFILDGKRIGDRVILDIVRNDISYYFTETLVPYYSSTYMVIMFVVGCLFFSLGVFVYFQRPFDKGARVFHWANLSVSVIIFTTWGNYAVDPYGLGHVVRIVFCLAYVLAPVLFLHFTFVFPRDKFSGLGRYYLPFYGIAAILFGWICATYIAAIDSGSMEYVRYHLTGFNATRIFFSMCVIGAIISIQHSYHTAIEELERRKLRWIMLGLVFGPLAYILFWQLPSTVFSRVLISEEVILIVLSIVPITFAISIIHYRLFNIDVIFYRTTVYAIVIVILLMGYSIIVGGVASLMNTFTVTSSIIVSAGSAVLAALLFQPLRMTVQNVVDKGWFSLQSNYREVLRLLREDIRHTIDSKQLAQVVIKRIESVIHAEKIGIMIHYSNDAGFKMLACTNIEGKIQQKPLLQILHAMDHYKIASVGDRFVEQGIEYYDLSDAFQKHQGIVLILPVPQESKDTVCCMILGEKINGTRYSLEDIDLLSKIAVQAGYALERILLQKQLVLEHAAAHRHEELSRMKSYFVSSVSHELKTPLTSIRLFAEMLRDKKKLSPRKYIEYLQIIEGESERLQRLIENILDFSKIERGIKEYHFERIEFNEVVRRVLKLFRYQLMIHHFRVATRISRKHFYIQGDTDALIEVIMNLLSNAIKYSTETKYISVVTALKQGDVSVSVTDRGIGICESEFKKIFKPYYRCQDESSSKTVGSGLGLALVNHIVTAHDGRVEVSSKPGKGSTFTIHLPQYSHN